MTNPSAIVGAGLAGLIAAHVWPRAPVLEIAPGPGAMHRALLRFRSDSVSQLTRIDFRRVRVRKGLWAAGGFRAPDIRLANLYAQKVLGPAGLGAGERSVWNLEPVDRFVAPDNFYEQLIDQIGARIVWGSPASAGDLANRAITHVSTAPLPVILGALGLTHFESFERAPITVERWRVPGADLYQTIYFPEPETTLYRASITGSALILEYAGDAGQESAAPLAARAFGLDAGGLELEETVGQKYGKIRDINPTARKELLFQLTHEHAIYSLGRFATYRNILLDDVVQDIAVIQNLMASGALYDLRRAAAGRQK